MIRGFFKDKPQKSAADIERLGELAQKAGWWIAQTEKLRTELNGEIARMLPELIESHERAEKEIGEFIKLAQGFNLTEAKTLGASLQVITSATRMYRDLLTFFKEGSKGAIDG